MGKGEAARVLQTPGLLKESPDKKFESRTKIPIYFISIMDRLSFSNAMLYRRVRE